MSSQPLAHPRPILFVDHAQRLGGAEHSLLLLMHHLDKTFWQAHLACPAGDLANAAKSLAIPWYNVTLPRLRRSLRVGSDWYLGAATLADITRQTGASMVVANTVRAAFFVALASKMSKRPFLWHMRDFWLSETQPRWPQLDWLLKTMLCRSAMQVIANSHATASHLPCHQVQVIHNGLNLHQFDPTLDSTAFRQAHHIPPDAPLVGIVGRLRPWKGQHRFIEMATAVAPTHPSTHFIIVGGNVFEHANGYANSLRDLANRAGLTDKIHFTGQIKEVDQALAAMDIFVHSGDPEPFGMVNIEAMAMGKPVVAFAHGALPEIVQHGETGFLVPPTDLVAMATAVSSRLSQPEQAKKIGKAGRERVIAQFTIQKTATSFSDMLLRVLG